MANITVKFQHEDIEWLAGIFGNLTREIGSITDRINQGYFTDEEGNPTGPVMQFTIQLNSD